MKKCMLLTFVMALVFGIVGGVNTAHAAEDTAYEDELIVYEYFEALDERDWDTLVSLAGDQYAAALESYLANYDYINDNLGLYSIEGVEQVEVIGEIPLDGYGSIVEECEGEDIKIYVVKSTINTLRDDEFYNDGVNYNLFFIGTVNGVRSLVAFRMPLPETIEMEFGQTEALEYMAMRFADDGEYSTQAVAGCTYNTPPSTVKVCRWYYGDGSIETVNLRNYVKTVAARELGYVSRDEDYHKAGVLAIRNYTWFHILTADSNAQYHVTDTSATNSTYTRSFQNYNPASYWNNTTWQTIYDRTDAVWSQNFLGTEYNHIFSWYTSNDNYGAENSGRMNLNLANNKANAGMTYKQILEAFYGYSTAEDASSGALRWYTVGEHVFYQTAADIESGLRRYCKCGYSEAISFE